MPCALLEVYPCCVHGCEGVAFYYGTYEGKIRNAQEMLDESTSYIKAELLVNRYDASWSLGKGNHSNEGCPLEKWED